MQSPTLHFLSNDVEEDLANFKLGQSAELQEDPEETIPIDNVTATPELK
jgi:hypothetical protein